VDLKNRTSTEIYFPPTAQNINKKGKERKGKERKGKERKGKETAERNKKGMEGRTINRKMRKGM
jgi:hypothetical protein